jgi:hypothetical protein
MGQTAAELYREREHRIMTAIELKVPDRVPVSMPFSYFPAKFAGVTPQDAFYDFGKWKKAYIQTALYFAPDRCSLSGNQSGRMLEILDNKQMLWPGHGVSIHHSHQYVEGEAMRPEEYAIFLRDPTGYMLRYYLPQVYGKLSPLSGLPGFDTLFRGLPFDKIATPEFVGMLESITQAAAESVRFQSEFGSLVRELADLGFPSLAGFSGGLVPFDTISDHLRGMRGAMLDMYRRPQQLLAACDMLSRLQIERIAAAPKPTGLSLAFIPLHRGADGFMSLKQFETFYWPYLKKMVEALVAAGFIPDIFFEGDYTSRLQYLRELPRGKVLGRFDRSDMSKVKAVLGDRFCISGNVPSSLLQTGTTEDVKKYCQWLIDVVGKNGGFIMAPASSLDEVAPENLKTLIDFTKEYGKY